LAQYIISYDLRDGGDYSQLYDALSKLNASHTQNSVWVVEGASGKAEDIYNALLRLVDKSYEQSIHNDRLLVSEVVSISSFNSISDGSSS
jgi:CRISPR/Cas system-associated endoribonuclease Cas2